MTPSVKHALTPADRHDANLIWDYHQMHHELRPCSAAIALGSYDLGVATTSAELFHQGLFPVLVFTGATSSVTEGRFPRGEAVHYREHALSLGMPDEAILLEPHATNTGENIALSRQLLQEREITVDSIMLISMRYMQRRAYATCARQWPGVSIVCASAPLTLDEYITTIGDAKLVVDELVGDLQRIVEYPRLGFAIPQDVPDDVYAAYQRLLDAGFDSRYLTMD